MTGLVLGLDTSGDVRAGLARDGAVVASGGVADTRAHAERLMPLVDGLLSEAGGTFADLSAIVVGTGPGPFTGLRVGLATAETLGLALGLEVRGVVSLDVLAHQAARLGEPLPDEFVVAADARRREVYWARYAADLTRLAGPSVTAVAAVPDLPVYGPALRLDAAWGERARPGLDAVDAGVLAALDLPDAGLEPLYLRAPDATVPTRTKSTLPRLVPRRRP